MIVVASKRKKIKTLQKEYPSAIVADVTSKATTALQQLSPYYAHGHIPVPNSPGHYAACVEGVWQGLKVFEQEDVCLATLANATGKNIKRTVRKHGAPRGHRFGVRGEELLGYVEARRRIYIPTYRWMLEHYCLPLIERLRKASAEGKTIVLLDYDTNADIEDVRKPLSHASLIKAYAECLPPYEDALGTRYEAVPEATSPTTSATKPAQGAEAPETMDEPDLFAHFFAAQQ